MIAIIVHQMVAIATELIAQLFDDASHLLIGEICATDLYTLTEMELFAQFIVVTWCDLKDASEWKRMSTVGKLGAKYLHPGMEDTEAN